MRWFKHMTHSRRDEKLSALISELGMEGYGFYWMLLEVVAESLPKDATIAQVTYTLPQWSHLLYSHHHRVGKYLGKLGVTGLVTVKYAEGKVTVTIPNLLKYRDEYSRKSGHSPDKLPAKSIDTDTDTEYKKNYKKKIAPSPEKVEAPKLDLQTVLSDLQGQEAFKHLDVRSEYSRCAAWCVSNNLPAPSRKRLTNWLLRAEAPIPNQPPSSGLMILGNRARAPVLSKSEKGLMDFRRRMASDMEELQKNG